MIDAIDCQILDILQKDGRAQRNHISEKVGLTIPAVSERMKRLEKKGIIDGYHAKVNNSAVGKGITAFAMVVTSPSKNYDELIKKSQETNDIIECHSITGKGSYLLKIQTENTSTLEKLLLEMQSWPGVFQTQSHIVLSSYKEFSPIIPSQSVIKK